MHFLSDDNWSSLNFWDYYKKNVSQATIWINYTKEQSMLVELINLAKFFFPPICFNLIFFLTPLPHLENMGN